MAAAMTSATGILSDDPPTQKRFMLMHMHQKNSQVPDRIRHMNALRAFEAAARHGSFVRAAAELHVTHGAVSRQIRLLEEALGTSLFERRNRAVFLTPPGRDLAQACQEAFSRVADALRRIRSDRQDPPLVVSCEPTVAIRWLVPRLAALREHLPNLRIHLLTAGGPVDFARDRVDIALRRNDFPWADQCHAVTIGPELMGPVCVPALSGAVAAPRNQPGKLRLLHARTRPTAWKRWLELTKRHLDVEDEEQFEHFYLTLQAAEAGLGIAMGSAYMVDSALGHGRLVAPYGFVPDGSEYAVLSPIPVEDDARRLAFVDWLRYEMGKTRSDIASLSQPQGF